MATVAGGDYAIGKIEAFSGEAGRYSFRFVQTQDAPLLAGCPQFTVTVRYARVPWFSWIPYVRTNHPTRLETEDAAAYLRNAHRVSKEVSFGYMGGGLAPVAGEHCAFASRGMAVEGGAVLSFYAPV